MITIDLIKLLSYIDDYVLIKRNIFFPNYQNGDDLDLIVLDIEQTISKIYTFYKDFVENKDRVQLKVTNFSDHCHVDFLFDFDILLVRCDLIDNFKCFKKINVKNSFITKIFKDRQLLNFNNDFIYIPSSEDELTVRYLEYLEYFDIEPSKTKHLDYICQVEDFELKKRFFDNTHNYINFFRKEWKNSLENSPLISNPNSRKEAFKSILVLLKFIFYKSFLK